MDDYNIFIDWDDDRRTFLEKTLLVKFSFIHNEYFKYYGYTISSRIFNSNEVFKLTFNYVNEKLTSINISSNEFNQLDIENSYKKMQCFLIEKLGKPFMNLTSKHKNRKCVWKFKKIKVIHVIADTFASNEIIEIQVV